MKSMEEELSGYKWWSAHLLSLLSIIPNSRLFFPSPPISRSPFIPLFLLLLIVIVWAFVMALFSFFFSVTIIMCAFVIALFSLFSVTTINNFVLDHLHPVVIAWFSFFSVDHLHPVVMALFRLLSGPVKNFVLNHLYLVLMALFPFFFTFFSFQIKNFLWDHRYILLVGSNVKALTREFDILTEKWKDVQKEIEKDETSMKKPTEEVQGWMKRVEDLQPSVESIVTAYDNQSYLRNICSVSIQAVNKSKEVRREVEIIRSARPYTTAPPPPTGQQVPTATLAAPGGEIDLKLRMALDFLKDDAQGMLGVWGMGGVGKTTLLKHINNAMVKNTSFGFDRVVFVTASRGCTIEKIQMSIANELGLSGATIYNYLSNNSFLILVDDLWEFLDIEEMGIPFPLGVIKGHMRKMILVSRSQKVLHDMGVRQSIRVECLSREAARLLFQENVGAEAINSHPQIPELANQVADQCDGLPQALITIGRAMAENRSIVSWENAVEDLRKSTSNFSEIHDITGDPLPLLKVSYDYLKDEGKQQCLLHCALWPEDWRIRKDELIQCWMGHGLLGEFNNLQEAYRKGHATIESLHKASLLEQAEYDNDDELKDDYVKLHDLIRDMALWIVCDCGVNNNKWIVLAGQHLQEAPREEKLWREAHKISLMFINFQSLPSEIQNNSSNLTTLMLSSNRFLDERGLRMSKCFNSLKYLDISGCCDLSCFPTEICGLTKLEYLNISNTSISSLPEELKALVNMKYLIGRHIYGLNSRVPPQLLSNLVNLIELDLFWSGNEDFVSSVIDSLGCLEGRLKGLGIIVRTVSDLQKLVQLSGIPIRSLYLKGMVGLSSSLELLSHGFLGSQHIRSNLKELILDDCDSVVEVVVEGRSKLKNIERLCLWRTRRLDEIKWKGAEPRDVLPKLRQVDIGGSCDALKSIEWVIYLPCLELLNLGGCKEMEQMFGEEAGAAGTKQEEEDRSTFPSLRRLDLYNMPKLSSICNRPLTFPSLEVLSIYMCEQLKKLPFHSPSSCTKLRKIEWDKATWEGIDLEENMRATLEPLLEIQD